MAHGVMKELAGFAPAGISVSYGGHGGWGGAAALQLRVPPPIAARFAAAVRAENVSARLILPDDIQGGLVPPPGVVLLGLGLDYHHDEIHHAATAVAKAAHYLIEDSVNVQGSQGRTSGAARAEDPNVRNTGKRRRAAALLLMAHGTKDRAGQRELVTLLESVARRVAPRPVALGVLEYPSAVTPSIQEAADTLVMRGMQRVVAVPVLLLQAGHGKLDMPQEFALAQARHPDVDWRLAQPLLPHRLLRGVVQERVYETLARTVGADVVDSTNKVESTEATSTGSSPTAGGSAGDVACRAAILLVGRGTHDASANADFYRVARLFAEEYGWPLVEACFISQTTPGVGAGLRRCAALGACRIVVVPYFLNTGILVQWISEQVAKALPTLPGIEVRVTAYLGVHDHVISLLLLRAREAALGVYARQCLAGTTGQGMLRMFSAPASHQHAARASTGGAAI